MTYVDQRNLVKKKNNGACIPKNKDDRRGGRHIHESLFFLVNRYIILLI